MGREHDTEAISQATREAKLNAIIERGRQTRKSTPRWLWFAATVVGVICVTGFALAMLADRAPPGGRAEPSRPGPAVVSGLGIGLVIGAGAGIAIGFSIGRQRRAHSSRNNP